MSEPSGRKVWVGTSWKMNKTIDEAISYAWRLVPEAFPGHVQAFVLPPHTALASVRDRLPAGSPVLLGAQNAHWEREGAGTGEISMRMVEDAGGRIVEIGHSERRARFAETDRTVALKARAALDHGLTPLICVGEPATTRAAGRTDDHVAAQLRAATASVSPEEFDRVLVAYEPIWAIGAAGRPARPEEVAPVMRHLRSVIAERAATGRCLALLYGGGVDSENAAALLERPEIDGLFVGRAAWTAAGFLELVDIAATVRTS